MEEKKDVKIVNKGLTVKKLLQVATNYMKGDISQKDYDEFIDTIIIKSYIPITEKIYFMQVLTTLVQFSAQDTQEEKIAILYENIFFYVYLEGYLGISDVPLNYINHENYDIMYQVYGPIIEKYAKNDLRLFNSMLHDVFDFYGLNSVADVINGVDYEKLEENTKNNVKAFKELQENKDLIKDLSNILDYNDPFTQKILKEVQQEAEKLI